jgi:DNA-binding transcriptional MocR family regulator
LTLSWRLRDQHFLVNPSPYRYRALASTLAEDLRAGHYPPGTQLPSVRHLCVEHDASLATVTRALHELEDAGLIEARPRRGFFASVPAAARAAPPGPAAIALAGRRKRLIELAATQPGCLSLGHLALPASLLPLPALSRLLTQQLRADAAPLATGSVHGLTALREQLALRSRRMGCHFDAEDIVLTQGEGESLTLCLRLLAEPGDLIAVASPAPLRALELIASQGLRALEIPASPETGLSVPALALALQQHRIAACLVEPSFYHVTGSLMSDGAKRDLLALLAPHQLPLIECDMMGDLHHGAQRPRPLKAFDGEDRVLYCGSLACITGAGFSVGYVVSGRHRLQLRAARAVHGELLPQLTEQVLADFIAGGGLDRHLRRLRRRLALLVAAHREAVLMQFPPGTRVNSAGGGHVLWVELPGGLDACTLLEQARRCGYTFVPGAVFSSGTQFDHCLRLTAGHPLDAARAQGIRCLGELAARLLAG